jgi:hypothetical protein
MKRAQGRNQGRDEKKVRKWKQSREYRKDAKMSEEKEMSFLDHIEELRWPLIRSVIVGVVAMIGVFIFLKDITDKVILAPYSSSFPTYQYLCKIDSSLCKDIRWDTDEYAADAIFIAECYSSQPNAWIYVNRALSYYNYITHLEHT